MQEYAPKNVSYWTKAIKRYISKNDIFPNFIKNDFKFSESNLDKGFVSFVFGYSIYMVGDIFPVFFFKNISIDLLNLRRPPRNLSNCKPRRFPRDKARRPHPLTR